MWSQNHDSLTSALYFHVVIETMAGINFLFRPSATFTIPQPYSHGVVRQYGILLLVTNMIVVAILNDRDDVASKKLTASFLSMYHVGPLVRAASRLKHQDPGSSLGGPWLHTAVHTISVATLVAVVVIHL